jgi:glutamyl-tRNA synthetase
VLIDEGAWKLLTDDAKKHLRALAEQLNMLDAFTGEKIEALFRDYANANALKLGAVAQPFRAALTGSTTSPPIFGAAELLGKEECLGRIQDALK